MLKTYANQAALAMENSLLYEQIEAQLLQMEQLYQVTRSVTSSSRSITRRSSRS